MNDHSLSVPCCVYVLQAVIVGLWVSFCGQSYVYIFGGSNASLGVPFGTACGSISETITGLSPLQIPHDSLCQPIKWTYQSGQFPCEIQYIWHNNRWCIQDVQCLHNANPPGCTLYPCWRNRLQHLAFYVLDPSLPPQINVGGRLMPHLTLYVH